MCYKLAFCIIAKSFFSISQDIVLITCNYNLSREEPVELHDNSNWIPEKAMATHSSTLAWKTPWTEEPGRLQSMGSRLSDFTFTFHFHELEKEMATHSSVLAWRIPGMVEPGGLLSMGLQSRTRLKQLSSSSNSSIGYKYKVVLWRDS